METLENVQGHEDLQRHTVQNQLPVSHVFIW